MLRRPAPPRIGTPPQHAGVAARHIRQHAVEPVFALDRRDRLHLIQTQPIQVRLQALTADRIDLLRDQPPLAQPPSDLDRLAARRRTEIQNLQARLHIQKRHSPRRGGILHDERTFRVALDLSDLPSARQQHERLRRARAVREPRLGRFVVPAAQPLGVRLAVARDPTTDKTVWETLALRKRSRLQVVLKFRATADQVPQHTVHDLGDALVRTSLRGGDGFVHGSEVRHVRHVENLCRPYEKQRLHLTLRPLRDEPPQHGTQGAEAPHRGVGEILHKRPVRAIRQHLVQVSVGRNPARDRERSGSSAIQFDSSH